MTLALKALLFCSLALSGICLGLALNSAQPATVGNAVQLSERVYTELRAADEAGANITTLADQYNSALNLIDQAERLDSAGDHAGAASLADHAQAILQPIPLEAEKLRSDALSQQQTAKLDRLLAIPIGAFIVALTVVGFTVIRRRVRFKQIMEMRLVAK